MNYQEVKALERAERLRSKFSNKSYSENWKNLRSFIAPVAFLIQLITATLAVALPAYLVKVISGSWLIGFIIGGVVLLAFEAVKRVVVNKTTIQYFRAKGEGSFKFGGVVLVALILAASVASSTFGTPILVEEFSPLPKAVDEEAILAVYDKKREEASGYWQKQKEEATAKAKDIHKKNNWKGITVKAARSSILVLESQAKASVDSLNTSLAGIAVAEAEALNKAEAKYSEALADRQKEKGIVGIALAFVTLALELIFILCFYWLNYYDYREALESNLLTFKSFKSSSKTTVKPKKVIKVDEAPSQSIGFKAEGKIVREEGKLKILCKTRAGLKAYDKSYLSTLVSSTKDQPKNSYWLSMKKKLEEAI